MAVTKGKTKEENKKDVIAKAKDTVTKGSADLAARAAQAQASDAAVRGANGLNVTFVSICQKTAQALEEDNPLYIDGLKQKDFYVQSKKLKLGSSIRVVPLSFIGAYNENTRDTNPKFLGVWHKDDALRYDLVEDSYYDRELPSGNVLRPVTWVVCYLPDFPELERVVITFKSTANKVAKAWMKDVDANAKASCELLYNLRTVSQKNDNGSWFEIDFELLGKVYELDKKGNLSVVEDFAEAVIEKSIEYNEAYVKGTLIPRRSHGNALRIAADRSARPELGDDSDGADEDDVPNF